MEDSTLKKCVKTNAKHSEVILEVAFLTAVFVFTLMWAIKAPFDASPDESMRFQIAEYIMDHGSLPDGRDPSIRNANWGISYAFNPITTYIIAAGFGKITSLFTNSFTAVYRSMRLVNVIFGTLTAFFALKIGKRLFEKEAAWFFAVLVSFLPGAVFIHSYINMDSIAVFSTAWIVYCWVRAVQDGWTNRLCIQLAAAMSVCALSYYNAYGFLLCSALFFAGMMLKCREKQWDFREMLKKGIFILILVFIFAGWWFIRNAVLYDGDILGMSTSRQYAQMYAIDELKPSNRQTPSSLGMSLYQMMIWQPGTWKYNWFATVLVSFIGTFGHMDIFMPELWSKGYLLFLFVGIIGNVFYFREKFSVSVRVISEKKEKDENGTTITRILRKNRVWNAQNWMHQIMILAIVIPVLLLIYYAYFSDFQAQGRYMMPALIPMMYFVTWGYDCLLKKLVKSEKIRKICFLAGMAAVIFSAVMVYFIIYAVNY